MRTGRTAVLRDSGPGRLARALRGLGVLVVVAVLVMLAVDRIFSATSTGPAGTGSGDAATQARSLPPFTGIELAGANNVVVRVGGERSVAVHADSNLLAQVTTRVRSGTLVIGTTPGNLSARSPMYVTVGVPSLDTLTLQGTVVLRGLIARAASATLAGDGTIMLTATRRLAARISGNGTILYGGDPPNVTRRITGSGTIVAG
jgi:putative autotransporter adhesin-like protein